MQSNDEVLEQLSTKELLAKIRTITVEQNEILNQKNDLENKINKLQNKQKIGRRILAIQSEFAVILKKFKTFFGNSYTLEEVYMKLQPLLNEYGVVLEYDIKWDTSVPVNPIIYYPSKENSSNSEKGNAFVRTPKTTTTTVTTKDGVDKPTKNAKGDIIGSTRVFVDLGMTTTKVEESPTQILGKTVFFFRFDGYFVNADDVNDKIPFKFSIPAEAKDQLYIEQAISWGITFAFRTNLVKFFSVPTPDKDADFENAPESVKESLKAEQKDNEFSTLYKDLLSLDNQNPYILTKENHFQTNLKSIYSDCNSFYEYLKYKYTENTPDMKDRAVFRAEMKKEYNRVYALKVKGTLNGTTN